MAESASTVTLSDTAAKRIVEITADEPVNKMLRVSVEGGGCTGFQYKFDLVADRQNDDLVVENGGATMLVDAVSLPFLAGSEVDFVNELIGAMFQVRNPNATASCGCGTSFTI
jgi:iron-sulfur cluster assembly accessory protein